MKVCSKCGVAKDLTEFYKQAGCRDGRRPDCKACLRQRSRDYQAANRDRVLQTKRTYARVNAALIKERRRSYEETHRQEACDRARRWAQAHPEQVRSLSRGYYMAHIDRIRARTREWNRLNPERRRESKAYRRQQELTGTDRRDRELSVAYRMAIANDPCVYCGRHASIMHIDHMMPIARGGTDHWWNLARACADCNFRKRTKTVEEFLAT